MNRTEGEQLVERYLSGAMTGTEEQDFFIQVATDSNLRHTLKAYQIVDTAIRKHRDALPSQHSAARSKLTGMLNLPPQLPAVPAAASVRAGRYTTATAILHRWRAMVVASASIALLVYWAIGLSGENPTPKPTSRVSAGALHETASQRTDVRSLTVMPPPTPIVTNGEEKSAGRNLKQVERWAGDAAPRHQAVPESGRPPLPAPRELHGGSAASRQPATRRPDLMSPAELRVESGSGRGAIQEGLPETPRHLTPRMSARDTIKIRVKIALPQDR